MSSFSMTPLQQRLADFEALVEEQLATAETEILYSTDKQVQMRLLGDVRSGIQELEAGMQRITFRLRRQTNVLTPMNRMPHELLERIFEIAAAGRTAMVAVQLSHVCYLWRSAALGFTTIWRAITVQDVRMLSAMPVLLARAGRQPVDLRLVLHDPELKDHPREPAAALQCLASHMGHIETLIIDFSPEFRKTLFRKLCEVPAPVLRHLSLSCTQFSSRYPLPGSMFNGAAPRLVALELSRVSPINLGKAFRGLKTIELRQSSVNVEVLRRVAGTCPNVQEILLSGWEAFSSRTPMPREPVLLSFGPGGLEQITFVDLRPDLVENILAHLDTGQIDAIKVKSGAESRTVSHLPLLGTLLGTLGPIVEALVFGWPTRVGSKDLEPNRRAWHITVFDRQDVARELMFEESLALSPRGALNPEGRLLEHARKLTVDARAWAPFIDSIDAHAPALGVLKVHVPESIEATNTVTLWHLDAHLKPVSDSKQPLRCPGLRKLTLRADDRVEVSAESVLRVLDTAIELKGPKLPELRFKNVYVKPGMGLEVLRSRVEELVI